MSNDNNSLLFDYDVCTKTRMVYIADELTSENTARWIKAIRLLDKTPPSQPIGIHINSPGGDIQCALALYDTIRTRLHPVITWATGEVSSAALMVFLAGQERNCTPLTRFMHHPGTASLEGGVKSLSALQRDFKLQEEQCNAILAERTEKPLSYWSKVDFDKIYTAEQALKYGIVTEIIQYVEEI